MSPQDKPDIFSMSDEEIMNLPDSAFDDPELDESDAEDSDDGRHTEDDVLRDDDPDGEHAGDNAEIDSETSDDEELDDEEDDGDPEEDGSVDSDSDDNPDSDSDTSDSVADAESSEGDDDPDRNTDSGGDVREESDYKGKGGKAAAITAAAEYAKILAPFKANGETMQVKNSDEAIRLMQQGANYFKKMDALGPHLKTVRTLDNNKIDSDRLNYLIDLSNGDKAAVAKFMRENEVDTFDLEDAEVEAYTPTNHHDNPAVAQGLELEHVLDNIKDTPSYPTLVEHLGRWDDGSKEVISQHPVALEYINTHIANGMYDVIMSDVAHQRGLGGLRGLTDLQAYQQVGGTLSAEGKLSHLSDGKNQQNTTRKSPPKQKANDPKLNARRRAAGNARKTTASPSQSTDDFNPLNMSDEEYENKFSELI